ncbi:glycosyltransferase PgfS [Facklamia sp. P12932]|uniref:glycosyltransferase PgfS n=1 Tax=Facklamia sp. P12932 TaxID=3421947 RepID=UPI003D177725
MKITILIPFYNEEEMIEKTHQVLSKELKTMVEFEFELLYVNDGSSDHTLELMRKIAEQDERVKYLSFSRNFGKEAAMLAGFDHASGEAVIIMDGDLQNPPYLIKEMIAKYQEGYDVVNAKRSRDGERKTTSFFAKIFYKVANTMMDVELTDGVSDFRLLSRPAINAITSLREYNRFSKGLFSWIGFKETVIEYENELRQAGQTKWSFKKSLNYALDGILSFSNHPLRMIFGLGLTCIAIAGLYIILLLFNYFSDPSQAVSGYFTTIFTIVFFGGVQLVSIGVLGEYIGKIFYEVKGRPHYIIEESNIKKGDQE